MFRHRIVQWLITIAYPFLIYVALYADWKWRAVYLYLLIWAVYALVWRNGWYLVVGTLLQGIVTLPLFFLYLNPKDPAYFAALPSLGVVGACLIAAVQYLVIWGRRVARRSRGKSPSANE